MNAGPPSKPLRWLLGAGLLLTVGWVGLRSWTRHEPAAAKVVEARQAEPAVSPAPAQVQAAKLALQLVPPAPAPSEPAPTVPAAELVSQHFAVAAKLGTPDETGPAYDASIAALRARAKEVIFELYDEYVSAEAGSLQRYAAVKTLSDLVAPEAYDALHDIARTPLPPEPAGDKHAQGPSVDERVVRIEAVDGLANLAEAGYEPAAQTLYEMAIDPAAGSPRSLRMAAISGFIGSGPEAPARALALKSHLPAELQSAAVVRPSQAEAKAAFTAMQLGRPD